MMEARMPDKGNFFKDRRDELRMTQREIAVQLEVFVQTVSDWERNLYVPKLELAAKLAEVYKVSEARIIRAIVELSKAINEAKSATATK
jgi:transcriptional regulator with XRE-family HTH domain